MAVERYKVEHETRYAYRVPVSQSWQLAHLTPRELPWQHVLAHELRIDPATDERREERDDFGNGVTHFAVYGPHPLLRVRMLSQVEIGERPDPAAAEPIAWEAVRDAVRGEPAEGDLAPARLSEPSALVPWSEAARAYAAPSFAAGRDWLEAIVHLRRRIHADFEFEPGATTVSTQVDEVLEQRSGVCQDFAHVMLACLRGQGLPGRYVSGYLRTDPPPGRARLLGVDASHAWVAAWSPHHGWVELDPTNDTRADQRYITLAWGADFADVVPLRGVILGGRGQSMGVAVSVIPEQEEKTLPVEGARLAGVPKRPSAGWRGPVRTRRLAAFATRSRSMQIALAEPLSLLPTETSVASRPGHVGPGWFDSSWELRSGLQVKEGLPADLPLQGWIEAWLQIVGSGSSLSLSAA